MYLLNSLSLGNIAIFIATSYTELNRIFQQNCITKKKSTFKIKYKLVADMIYAILMGPGTNLLSIEESEEIPGLANFPAFLMIYMKHTNID